MDKSFFINLDHQQKLVLQVEKIIANKFHIKEAQASTLFSLSKLYTKILNGEEFIKNLSPEDLYSLWKSERLTNHVISDADIKSGKLEEIYATEGILPDWFGKETLTGPKDWYKKREYVELITQEVSKMIAKKYKTSYKEARADFIDSKVYTYLAYSDEDFIEEGPEDFFDLYNNLKKYGRMISSTDLYIEKHPEYYKLPNSENK